MIVAAVAVLMFASAFVIVGWAYRDGSLGGLLLAWLASAVVSLALIRFAGWRFPGPTLLGWTMYVAVAAALRPRRRTATP